MCVLRLGRGIARLLVFCVGCRLALSTSSYWYYCWILLCFSRFLIILSLLTIVYHVSLFYYIVKNGKKFLDSMVTIRAMHMLAVVS